MTGPSLLRVLGVTECLLASASLALAAVDIVITLWQKCDWGKVSCISPLSGDSVLATLFSFIASGVWASLAVFVVGILTIKHDKKPKKSVFYIILGFLTAFIFTPAMIILNALEAYWIGKTLVESLGLNGLLNVKFIIPVAVGALGFSEMVFAVVILIKICLFLYAPPAAKSKPEQKTEQGQDEPAKADEPPRDPRDDRPYADDAAAGYGPRAPYGYYPGYSNDYDQRPSYGYGAYASSALPYPGPGLYDRPRVPYPSPYGGRYPSAGPGLYDRPRVPYPSPYGGRYPSAGLRDPTGPYAPPAAYGGYSRGPNLARYSPGYGPGYARPRGGYGSYGYSVY